MAEWQVVQECPRCGAQVTAGVTGPGQPPVTMSPVRCSFGHEPVEMEQKLAPAALVTPDEMEEAYRNGK